MKPSPNGKAGTIVARTDMGARLPIGRVPQDLTTDERAQWNEIIKECPWVDKSHRKWVRGLAMTAARVNRITDFFRRRQKAFAAEGEDIALAYLDDDGKRHPLMTDLLAAEEGLRKALVALGASPASQVKMMSDFGNAKAGAQEEANRARFFA